VKWNVKLINEANLRTAGFDQHWC